MSPLSHVVRWLAAVAMATCGTRATPAPAPRPAPVAPGWVDVSVRIPDAVIDMRYATADNFTHTVLYPVARCLLRADVGERLARAADALREQGHRILLWDCYRPASIQRQLWQLVPDPRYVAEPTFDDAGKPIGGSKHSRGAAVDVSLAALDGTPREMPTAHDAFGPEASGSRAKGAAARHHAALRAAMVAAGFEPMATEWWHYDAASWKTYPLSDESLR
jgi:D-alanyl-D-alanine dipeptidase